MRGLPAVLLLVTAIGACGGTSAPRAPAANAPVAAPDPQSAQALYEAGRYAEVLSTVAAAPVADDRGTWFAAESEVRLGQPDAARARLARLDDSASLGWRAASEVARARLAGDGPALQQAIENARRYPQHAIAQLERGLGHMARGEYAEAAQAFETSLGDEPRLAYAYYYSALAHNELGQPAMVAARLETFVRLAPEAPEVPEAQSILNTAR